MVIFPKKYFTLGLTTVKAPSPSHRLSRAKQTLCTGTRTTDTPVLRTNGPSSMVVGRYSFQELRREIEHVGCCQDRLALRYRTLPRRPICNGSHPEFLPHRGPILPTADMDSPSNRIRPNPETYPVPPPAARNAISRKRPISFKHVRSILPIYDINFVMALIGRSVAVFQASAPTFRTSLSIGAIISSIYLLAYQQQIINYNLYTSVAYVCRPTRQPIPRTGRMFAMGWASL